MSFADVNLIAIAVAAVVDMAIGALWYSRLLFAERWMLALGLQRDEVQQPPTMYAVTAVAWLVVAYVLAVLMAAAEITSVGGGAVIGLLTAVGLVATTTLINSLFAGRPLSLYLIDVGYHVAGFAAAGAIIGAF